MVVHSRDRPNHLRHSVDRVLMDTKVSDRKDQTFLNIAHRLAGLSTCDRKHVGAVITLNGRCISWGYNGAPPGMPHCSENNHGWSDCPHDVDHPPEVMALGGCRNATHAELNAVCAAAKQGISTDGGTLYVTVSPCEVCARALIAAGIARVVYEEEYRDERGLDTLRRSGISAECILDDIGDRASSADPTSS